MSAVKNFTGVRREKKTRWTVRLGDVVSRIVITAGGVGTIAAVSLVFLFLAYVVLPMFEKATVDDEQRSTVAWGDEKLLRLVVDEYRTLGWGLTEKGTIIVFHVANGEVVLRRPLFADAQMTAIAFHSDSPSVSVGFSDGTVRLGKIDISSELIDPRTLAGDARTLLENIAEGAVIPFAGGFVERTAQGGLRQQKLNVEFKDPIKIGSAPIKLVDHYIDERKTIVCAMTEDDKLIHTMIRRIVAIDGAERLRPGKKSVLPYQPRASEPFKLLLSGLGEGVLLTWKDGHAARFDCRSADEVALAEEVDLLPDRRAELTACELVLGRVTIIAGDSLGRMSAWFPIRPHGVNTVDGQTLVKGHDLPAGNAAVTSFDMSARSRMVLAGFANGAARLLHVTTEQTLVDLDVSLETNHAVTAVAMAPKDDGLYAATKDGLWGCTLDPKFPEITLSSLFGPVWYEQYPKPDFSWQAGGGSSDLEPKLSLVPLIFGTLKATFYSMIFGAPLALLAAIYTSEFLNPRVKAKIKPTIELMASLPSVVLGFLAGLVIAQFVESRVPQLLTTFVTAPVMVLVGAYLWQLLPQRTTILYGWLRLPAVLVLGIVGAGLGIALGPAVERILFAGDMMKWLNGQHGAGTGAWFMLLLPVVALLGAVFVGQVVNPWMRRRYVAVSRREFAVRNLVKFLAAVAAVLVTAYVSAYLVDRALFNGFGYDPRGHDLNSLMGTYIQRNALVVGFIMGFAIIPIIYTIADDALSTVPEHLRSASLGAGATPWQTAIRIVIPTAMSGLFSAVMIGLGRAVGETMIVLMAAGNTPIMEINIFNGFRTLAANIATELPEAPRDSTHYKTLFLAALVLFVMTFVVNTVAEVVRLRFRRRAYQL